MLRPRPQRPVGPLILCIEDNERYLLMRKAVLERRGFHVVAARTEEQALEILAEAPVCLTISDHMLRGTTGVDLARKMKAIKPDVPVVIYSGSLPDSMENVDAFINKNEPTTTFLEMIADLVVRYCS
ncbi:MAG TPA: response regulator [Terriglobales bacterium]|nr:response regulator [Terriglobales bacterium]